MSPETPVVSPGLHAARAVEIGRRDLAGPHQARPEWLGIAADRRGHHAAAIEADGARGLPELGRHAQHPALPAQVEQLEDVLDVQVLEWSLERHG